MQIAEHSTVTSNGRRMAYNEFNRDVLAFLKA